MVKEIKSLQDLTLDQNNPNKGTARGRYMVEMSLGEVGAGRSIVVDKDGKVIAGNKTLEVWAEMGGEIEVVRTDGRKLVVVQREDLDLSDPVGAARRMSFLDNRAGEVSLDWDGAELLAAAQAGLDLDSMFSEHELERLIGKAVELNLNFGAPQPTASPQAVPASPAGGFAPSPHGSIPQGELRPASATGGQPAHVVMVQLFFNTETHPPFVEKAKALMQFYDIGNLTDLVIRVVEDAYQALASQ